MRIRVTGGGHNINILLPTNLIVSRGTVWLANHFGRKYAGDAMKDIPPEAVDRLFREFRRMKKTYGTWELVEIHSCNGDEIHITL